MEGGGSAFHFLVGPEIRSWVYSLLCTLIDYSEGARGLQVQLGDGRWGVLPHEGLEWEKGGTFCTDLGGHLPSLASGGGERILWRHNCTAFLGSTSSPSPKLVQRPSLMGSESTLALQSGVQGKVGRGRAPSPGESGPEVLWGCDWTGVSLRGAVPTATWLGWRCQHPRARQARPCGSSFLLCV